MLGLEIFVHSIKMVLRNLMQALQISLVPALVAAALTIVLFLVFDVPLEEFDGAAGNPDNSALMSVLGFVVSLIVVVFGVMLWIVVSWHRFVLLEEYPTGFLPSFRFDRVMAYFGRLLMLIILGAIAISPFLLVVGAAMQASAVTASAVWLGIVAIMTVGFYRLSPILPGAAIGKSITIPEAWRATSGSSGALVVLVVLSLLLQLLLQSLSSLLLLVPIIGALIVTVVGLLVVPLINVSILTTIYGVFIEKRELT